MFDAIVLWLHILAAVVFIGPQVFLVAVAMPALRSMADVEARQALSRRITRGFGMLGGTALAVLLATGIWNFYDARDADKFDADRYFVALQIKLTLVVVVIVLTIIHGMVFGLRLQRLQEQNAPEDEIERVRRWSVLTSLANLAASVAILFFAAILASDWALQS
jgi:copper resistance protein D